MKALRPDEFLYFANGQLMCQSPRVWTGRPIPGRHGNTLREYRYATGQYQVASLTLPKRVA